MNKAEKKLLFDEFRSWLTETQGLEFTSSTTYVSGARCALRERDGQDFESRAAYASYFDKLYRERPSVFASRKKSWEYFSLFMQETRGEKYWHGDTGDAPKVNRLPEAVIAAALDLKETYNLSLKTLVEQRWSDIAPTRKNRFSNDPYTMRDRSDPSARLSLSAESFNAFQKYAGFEIGDNAPLIPVRPKDGSAPYPYRLLRKYVGEFKKAEVKVDRLAPDPLPPMIPDDAYGPPAEVEPAKDSQGKTLLARGTYDLMKTMGEDVSNYSPYDPPPEM